MIYFIQAGDNGPIKIGLAQDVKQRMAQIQTNHHTTLKLIGVLDGGRKQESQIHKSLANHRLSGEWFSPSPEVLEFVSANAYIPSKEELSIRPRIINKIPEIIKERGITPTQLHRKTVSLSWPTVFGLSGQDKDTAIPGKTGIQTLAEIATALNCNVTDLYSVEWITD